MLTALSHADHWSRTNLRAGVIGMELSHTLTAVVMSEVDSPQLTENAVYGGFWADCGVRRSCTGPVRRTNVGRYKPTRVRELAGAEWRQPGFPACG
jgi:hypothetical protein